MNYTNQVEFPVNNEGRRSEILGPFLERTMQEQARHQYNALAIQSQRINVNSFALAQKKQKLVVLVLYL